MPIYEKMQNAFNTRDTTGYLDLLHEDYQFVRHQSRTCFISNADCTPTVAVTGLL